MARRVDEPIRDADPSTVSYGPRSYREKLMSAAEAIGLEVNESWDDKQLEKEIKTKARDGHPDRRVI